MCAVSENILNLKEIYSNRSHYHQWVNNLGEVFLPGFGDNGIPMVTRKYLIRFRRKWCFRIISPLQTTKARRNSLTMCLTG